MPTTTFTYTTPSNYTTSDAEVSGGNAQLSVTTGPITYPGVIDSDLGYTYDPTKAVFTGGMVEQVDQTAANSILAGKLETKDLNWHKSGSVTGTLYGSPTFGTGKMVCTGSQGVSWEYTTTAIETHKFIYTPNYTTAPPANVNVFTSYNGTNNNDRFYLTNSPSGNNLRFDLRNSSGTAVAGLTVIGAFNPVAGTDYEFEIVLDSVAGTVRVFIDGTLIGTSALGAWTRGGVTSRTILGATPVVYNRAEASYDDYILFDNAQHTSSYVPGYTIVDTIYAETIVTSPEVPHSGPGTIISFDAFAAVTTGSPRFTFEVGQSGDFLYWDGSTWSTSNNTYAQATDAATFNANTSSIPVLGEVFGQLRIIFPDSNTISSVDSFDLTFTENTYSTAGSVVTNTTVSADALTSLSTATTLPANTNIKHGIIVDGALKYWDGAAWVTSDGSEAQLNTEEEITINAAALLGTQNSLLQLHSGLFTTDGTVTPLLDSASLVTDFGGIPSGTQELCTVWGYINTLNGVPISDVTVTVKLVEAASEYREAAGRILGNSLSTTTDSTGYWQLDLTRSSQFEGSGQYKVTFEKANVLNIKTNNNAPIAFSVPDAVSVELSTLITDV
jgi:hypothetical protein